jgi:hypothetical protein
MLALTAPRAVARMGYELPAPLSDDQLIESMHLDSISVYTKGSESPVKPVKDKLRVLCRQRRIRLRDFFEGFDTHHQKRLTKSQFKRALAQAGLTVPTTTGGAVSLHAHTCAQSRHIFIADFAANANSTLLTIALPYASRSADH